MYHHGYTHILHAAGLHKHAAFSAQNPLSVPYERAPTMGDQIAYRAGGAALGGSTGMLAGSMASILSNRDDLYMPMMLGGAGLGALAGAALSSPGNQQGSLEIHDPDAFIAMMERDPNVAAQSKDMLAHIREQATRERAIDEMAAKYR